jgi:hypothetical protein
MKQDQRKEALKIAKAYKIKVRRVWWAPTETVIWTVMGGDRNLTAEEYTYLTKNEYIVPDKDSIKNENEVTLILSEMGERRLSIYLKKSE